MNLSFSKKAFFVATAFLLSQRPTVAPGVEGNALNKGLSGCFASHSHLEDSLRRMRNARPPKTLTRPLCCSRNHQ